MYAGQHARTHPDRPAFVMASTGESVDYAEFDARTNRLAHVLRAHGLGRLAHYAIFMENNDRYLESCGAGERAGLYYTCVNSFLTPEEKQEIHDTYANDQNKLARYYYGEWVDFVTEGTVFEDVYRESIHIVPTITSGNDRMEWELIDAPRESHVFHTGWDMGNLNSAWVMGVPRNTDGEIAFDIVDEQV